jgi:hypothetical protein
MQIRIQMDGELCILLFSMHFDVAERALYGFI